MNCINRGWLYAEKASSAFSWQFQGRCSRLCDWEMLQEAQEFPQVSRYLWNLAGRQLKVPNHHNLGILMDELSKLIAGYILSESRPDDFPSTLSNKCNPEFLCTKNARVLCVSEAKSFDEFSSKWDVSQMQLPIDLCAYDDFAGTKFHCRSSWCGY